MIITYETQRKEISCVAWGRVNSEPFSCIVGQKQLPKTSFFLNIRAAKKGEERFSLDSARVVCWRKVAELASHMEKGDMVFVAGMLREDEYWTKKNGETTFYIDGDIVIPMGALEAAVASQIGGSIPSYTDAQINPADIFPDTDPDYTTTI